MYGSQHCEQRGPSSIHAANNQVKYKDIKDKDAIKYV